MAEWQSGPSRANWPNRGPRSAVGTYLGQPGAEMKGASPRADGLRALWRMVRSKGESGANSIGDSTVFPGRAELQLKLLKGS